MTGIELTKNLEIAIQASLRAGEAIMEVYNTTFQVEFKDDESPLTEADKRANEIINTYLKPTLIPIISEENKQIDFGTRRQWERCWIVDPVDGTKEFIKRNGEFTVNIALINEGKPVLGVIYVPDTKTIYFADTLKQKAFKSVLLEHSIKITEVVKSAIPLTPKVKTKHLEIVGSRSHMSPETLDFITHLEQLGNVVSIVSKGSSLKFCLVAEGNADIYPRFAPTMEWDTAAGQAICNAVGIDVISEDTKESLLYNKQNLLNPWFVVFKQ